jgi:hypothetical protein
MALGKNHVSPQNNKIIFYFKATSEKTRLIRETAGVF